LSDLGEIHYHGSPRDTAEHVSIANIGAGKAALFYGLKKKRHLRAYFEAVWHFESK